MVQQGYLQTELEAGQEFGMLLKTMRIHKKVRQVTIVSYLPGWSQTTYTRVENGEIFPSFDQLYALYRAFQLAGITFSPTARQQFVTLARKKIETKKTHLDLRSDGEWAELRYQLARLDSLSETPQAMTPAAPLQPVPQPLLTETSHLLGREAWHEEMVPFLTAAARKKVVILEGPAGIGKSSELNWFATFLFRQKNTPSRVLLCDFRPLERMHGPEEALDVFLGTVLADLHYVAPQTPFPSWEERTIVLLERLEKARQPIVVFVDHAECLLHEPGILAPCWERFLTKFLRSQHTTTLVIASKQWPGWYGGEHSFIAETTLAPLSQEKSLLLLQQLGLDGVPLPLLEEIYTKVGGIPLCLEWVAALAKRPLYLDDWDSSDLFETQQAPSRETPTQAVQRLLEEPHIFGGTLADAIAPLLERILATQRLSQEARSLLQVLSVANIPLAKPALQVLCPQGPQTIKELRRASVFVAYPNRIQLLPMVAAAMYRQLSFEQIREREMQLISAYTAWMQAETFHEREQGVLITALATLLFKHHHLLDAAQLLIRYGWLSFNLGHGSRLAKLAEEVLHSFDWHKTEENECGGLILYYLLPPFLGKPINSKKYFADCQYIQNAVLARKVILQPTTEVFVMYYLMKQAMNTEYFEEAQILLEACCEHLEPFLSSDLDLRASLLEKRGWLIGTWCEYALEQGDIEKAKELRQQVLTIYRQSIYLLSNTNGLSPLKSSMLKKRLARAFNNLGYHLNRIGQYEEALQAIEQSITLKELGYVLIDTLADAYGEKSQILMGLGRFQEALLFDEKALSEVQRCINTGYSYSQEEEWVYLVNRGCLYLRLGRIDEVEQVLQKALTIIPINIHSGRRIYQMFAKGALDEIEQWRQKTIVSHYQLDWRWVERYRELDAFDAYWWWAQAGPFTEEEQREWDQWYRSDRDETTKEHLGKLLAQSRDREVEAALVEQREPYIHYPALDIQEVRRRITGMQQLDAEIRQGEPNAIVRRLYQGAIEEEIAFLCLIEATYERNSERFRELNQKLSFVPTPDEMHYALSCVRRMVLRGLLGSETRAASEQVLWFLRERLQVSFDLSSTEGEAQALQQPDSLAPRQLSRKITAQAAKRFFETALQECGYEGWKVIIDPKSNGAHVEGALRHLFLADRRFSLSEIRALFTHEIAGHVARAIAGEHSPLGLLGIGTQGYLTTEEGITVYHERQVAALHGEPFDESGLWYGTLAVGLALGVVTPPQTFLSLCSFFESFTFLFRLLRRPDEDREVARKQARRIALQRCLRTFRGVPDLEKTGVCFGKDIEYLRGMRIIEGALVGEKNVLELLAVGRIALEHLPDIQELGIVAPPQPLLQLAYTPDLDSYIMSFDEEGRTVQ